MDDLPGLEEFEAPAPAPAPVQRKRRAAPDVVITLPGAPFGKGDPKSRIIQPKTGGPAFAIHYKDSKTRNYEAMLRYAAEQAMKDRPPFDCALQVMIRAYYPIPQSWSQKKQTEAQQGLIRPTVKPDANNVSKSCDGLNGVVWRDDAIIVDEFVRKYYSTNPRLEIEVSRWKPPLLV